MTSQSLLSRVRRLVRQITSPLLAVLVLLVSLVFQLSGLFQSGAVQGISDDLSRLGQPAWERGARSMLGDEFGNYIKFVHDLTPEDSSIVLPPHSIVQPYAEVGLMQFYFYPRKVYNCGPNEAEACMYRARTTHTYVLAMPHFPPPEEALKYKTYVPFDDRFGLYVPSETKPESGAN